jgi:hypothetical protein
MKGFIDVGDFKLPKGNGVCEETRKHIEEAREFFQNISTYEYEQVNEILFELKDLSVMLRQNRAKDLSAELERIKESLDALQSN